MVEIEKTQLPEIEHYHNDKLGFEAYHTELPCGLDLYVIPENSPSTTAHYTVPFGGDDTHFIDKDGQEQYVPSGIAHFLEHKMFAKKDGPDLIQELREMGTYTNAATSIDKTNYYVKFGNNFEANLEKLIELGSELHIDTTSVDKERGIIDQERDGRLSNAAFAGYFTLLQSMYHNRPEGGIIGTKDDILQNITVDNLYACFNTFYHPSNVSITVTGAQKVEDVVATVQNILERRGYTEKAGSPELLVSPEPEDVRTKRVDLEKDNVTIPMALIGFKYNGYSDASLTEKERIKEQIILENAVEATFGSSSDFYEKYKEDGTLGMGMSAGHSMGRKGGFSIFHSKTHHTDEFEKVLIEGIDELREGVNYTDFRRTLKSNLGALVRIYESGEKSANMLLSFNAQGIPMQDYLETYQSLGTVTEDEINTVIRKHFNTDNYSCVVVRGAGEKEQATEPKG